MGRNCASMIDLLHPGKIYSASQLLCPDDMYVCVRQVNASVGMTGIGVRNASAWSCTETTTGIIERGALCLPAHGGRQPIQTLIRRLAWCLVLQLRAGLACSQHRRRAVTAAIPSATKPPWPCRGHRHQRHRPGERDGHCAHRQRGAGGRPKEAPSAPATPGARCAGGCAARRSGCRESDRGRFDCGRWWPCGVV